MEKNHRLFIRNLPVDVNRDDLEKLFSKHGTITNIDIKDKIQNDGTKIGFVTINATDKMLNTCFREVNGANLGGNSIHLEVAKESYLDRLKREREEAANKKIAVDKVLPSKESIEPLNIRIPRVIKNKPTKLVYNYDDANNESKESENSGFDNASNNKFRVEVPIEKEARISTRVFEKPKEKIKTLVEQKPVTESEIKRLASLKQKIQTFKTHEKLISQALKSVDVKSKHVKFDFSEDNDEHSNSREKRKKTLFDDDENSDDPEAWDEDKFEHDEKRNAKLKLAMGSFGGDKRFTIDERFLDDEEPKDNVNEEEQEDDLRKEAKWQLNILENILGKPVKPKDVKSMPERKQNKMIRYDPTSNDHQQHELLVQKPVKSKKVKAKKIAVEEEETPIPVSNEMFYEVKENLTEALQPQEEFSLLKSFGKISSNENHTMEENEAANAISKEKWDNNYVVTKPFKYDSSDDEAPNPSMQDLTVRTDFSLENKKNSNDLFFFAVDDERFNEAREFFKTRPAASQNFTVVRRELKQIVRAKIRNNVRKNTPWSRTKITRQAKNRS